MGRPQNTTPEKFFRFVRKTATCWFWQGHLNKDGYGEWKWFGRKRLVHQVSYEIATGAPFPKPLITRHTCHNRTCVNPAHILPGTRTQNSEDMVAADRSPVGERHPNSRLTDDQRREIYRLRHNDGWLIRQLMERFGVGYSSVWAVIRRDRWAT